MLRHASATGHTNLPMRVRASRQKAKESFHVLICGLPPEGSRFRVTSNDLHSEWVFLLQRLQSRKSSSDQLLGVWFNPDLFKFITKICHQRTWTWYGPQVFLEFLIFLPPWDYPTPRHVSHPSSYDIFRFQEVNFPQSFLVPRLFLSYITYNLSVHVWRHACSHMDVEAGD